MCSLDSPALASKVSGNQEPTAQAPPLALKRATLDHTGCLRIQLISSRSSRGNRNLSQTSSSRISRKSGYTKA